MQVNAKKTEVIIIPKTENPESVKANIFLDGALWKQSDLSCTWDITCPLMVDRTNISPTEWAWPKAPSSRWNRYSATPSWIWEWGLDSGAAMSYPFCCMDANRGQFRNRIDGKWWLGKCGSSDAATQVDWWSQ